LSFDPIRDPVKRLTSLLDVRFLPNPYFVPDWKNALGTTKRSRLRLRVEESGSFAASLRRAREYLVPLYEKEGKT